MDNPIYASELFVNDGAIKSMAADVQLLREESENLRTEAGKLKKQIDGLNGSTRAQRDKMDEAAQEAARIQKAYRAYNQTISENAVKLEQLRAKTREQTRINKLKVKQLNAEKGSYDDLSAQYSLLKIKINKLSVEQRKNTEAGRAMVDQSKALYEQMKQLQEETGKHVLNVGNYRSALEDLGGPAGQAINQAGDFLGQLKKIAKNPAALAVGALAGGAALLAKAFSRTEKGARLYSRAQAVLNGLWDEGAKLVAGFADEAASFWDAPLQKLGEWDRAMGQRLNNSEQGFTLLAENTGKAIGAFFTKNSQLWDEATGKLRSNLRQIVTGLDEAQQAVRDQEWQEFWDRIAEDEAIDRARLAIARQNRELTKYAENLATQEALARSAADDTTTSLRQQIEATDELLAISERRAAAELGIARNNLSIIQRELAQARARNLDAEALAEREVAAIVSVEQAERELMLLRSDAATQRREQQRDLFERELDFAIDLYDSQNMVLQRQAADREQDLTQRSAALSRLIELDRSAFAEQIKLVEDFTQERVRLNELALIDDERIVRERLRQMDIDDVTMGRILEILRDRAAATQDILELERELTGLRRQEATFDADVQLGAFRKAQEEAERLDDTVRRIAERNARQGAQEGQDGLLKRLGIWIESDEIQALRSAVSQAVAIWDQANQAVLDRANQEVDASQRRVDVLQQELDAKIRSAELGYAVNLQSTENELALAKRKEEEALRIQKEAQREQQRIENLQQVSSLFTAVAKALASVPFPFNLAVGGTILGAYAAAKLRARRLTRNFRKGVYRVVQGPKHEGGGVYMGVGPDGAEEYVEGGEAQAIFTASAVRQYGSQLPGIVKAANEGNLDKYYTEANHRIELATNPRSPGTISTRKMERTLSAVERNTRRSVTIGQDGRRIETIRNLTIYYDK